jgi:hypothetical protein
MMSTGLRYNDLTSLFLNCTCLPSGDGREEAERLALQIAASQPALVGRDDAVQPCALHRSRVSADSVLRPCWMVAPPGGLVLGAVVLP